jgi:hypothetical protein
MPERKPLEVWQEGLVRAFESLSREQTFIDSETQYGGYPIGRQADINALSMVFDEAGRHVGFDALPPIMNFGPFRERLGKHAEGESRAKIERAIRALREMRIATPGQRPGGRRKLISPFTAAQQIAKALGLPFPFRERDLARGSKSGRRVSARVDTPLSARNEMADSKSGERIQKRQRPSR